MSDINVIQRTQRIIVNVAARSVSVINAGPAGPVGPAGIGDVTQAELDAVDAAKVNKAGDTMTGFLVLSADPTLPLHAATRQWVLAQVGTGGGSSNVIDGGAPNSNYSGTIGVDGGAPDTNYTGMVAIDGGVP